MSLILFMMAVMAVNAGDLTEIDEARASSVVQELQAKIDLEELLQPADADKLNCTQAWLLANSVLVANGYIFNDELAVQVFTFDMVYSPNYEVTYYTYADYLNPADTWNLDLLMGAEIARCDDGLRTLTVEPVLTPVIPDPVGTIVLTSVQTEVPMMEYVPQEEVFTSGVYDDSDGFGFDTEVTIEKGLQITPERRPIEAELSEPEPRVAVIITGDGDREEEPVKADLEPEAAASNLDDIQIEDDDDSGDEVEAVVQADPEPEPELEPVETDIEEEATPEPVIVQEEQEPAPEPIAEVVCPEPEPCPTCEVQDARIAELTTETEGLGEVVVTLASERDGLAAERDALVAERDQLTVDNGLLELRNENLVDANVASAQDGEIQQAASASLIAGLEAERDQLRGDISELELRNENLVDSNVALTLELSLASESVPFLITEDPVVTEEEIVEEEPVYMLTDYDTLYSSVAYGVVADKDLITTLDCEQTEGLYRAIPAQYGVPVEEAPALYNNTDKLNELRLVRQAREQGCTLTQLSGS